MAGIALQNTKIVNVTPPGAIVDNTSFTTAEIDTLGWEYCTIYVILGATDIAMAALKLQESDTSGSGFADVSGFDFSSDGTLPSATDDNGVFAFQVDLTSRERYLDVVATAGNGAAGTYAAIVAVLSRGHEAGGSATARGLTGELLG